MEHSASGNCIAPDKRGYQESIFLISFQNHVLWVPIRSAYVSWRNKKNEPVHDKTFKMACRPSEDTAQSDQSLRYALSG